MQVHGSADEARVAHKHIYMPKGAFDNLKRGVDLIFLRDVRRDDEDFEAGKVRLELAGGLF